MLFLVDSGRSIEPHSEPESFVNQADATLVAAAVAATVAVAGILAQAFFHARTARLALLKHRLEVVLALGKLLSYTQMFALNVRDGRQSWQDNMNSAQGALVEVSALTPTLSAVFGIDAYDYVKRAEDCAAAALTELAARLGENKVEEAVALAPQHLEAISRVKDDANNILSHYVKRDNHAGTPWWHKA